MEGIADRSLGMAMQGDGKVWRQYNDGRRKLKDVSAEWRTRDEMSWV